MGCSRSRAFASAIEVDPARLRPSDHPVLVGNPARIASRAGMEPDDPLRQDARRSARLLAPRRGDDTGVASREVVVTGFSETRRQMVHMAMGGFALLLRVMTWWQAALLAARPLLFNLFALPRLGGRAAVPASRREPRFSGRAILLYPLSVLLLILILPRRLDIVAAAWGIMAVGDGMRDARRTPRSAARRLPWNRDKSIAGTRVAGVTGAAAGMFLAWWSAPAVVPPPPLTFIIVAPVLAAIAAAAVESIPVRLDDNICGPRRRPRPSCGHAVSSRRSAATMARPTIEASLIPAAVVNIARVVCWLERRRRHPDRRRRGRR